ncbi:MAG TPA: HD domain-containing phosphohydrolase [Limnobacter sp.]|uniref:HD-GYP domain-containing protein n=1 Tax=Limnobacter sp. TaxID=2003368 RepID=UPI002ED7B744
MLITIPDPAFLQPLLQRKSIAYEHLYNTRGQRLDQAKRLPADGLLALESELGRATLLYFQARELFDELHCSYRVLSKALLDEDPLTFVPVINELAQRVRMVSERQFDLAYAYLSWHTSDDYPVMHPLLVALTLTRVAERSGYFDAEATESLLKAALTMNISMLALQARLRGQTEPLSREQREVIRRHPEQSASKLSLLGVMDELWLETVRLHHELPDGSGYPTQVRNEHPGSVLLGVCDSFNARMAQREYRANFTAEQAVKDLFSHGSALSSDFTAIILEELGIYPAGSLVQLMGNQIGCSLIRGETATTPTVLAFKNLPGDAPTPALLDTALEHHKVRCALPRRDLGQLPGLLELLGRVV